MQSQDTWSIWVSTNDTHCSPLLVCLSLAAWEAANGVSSAELPFKPWTFKEKARLAVSYWRCTDLAASPFGYRTKQDVLCKCVCVPLQSANCDVAAISPLLMMHCYSSRVSSSSLHYSFTQSAHPFLNTWAQQYYWVKEAYSTSAFHAHLRQETVHFKCWS